MTQRRSGRKGAGFLDKDSVAVPKDLTRASRPLKTHGCARGMMQGGVSKGLDSFLKKRRWSADFLDVMLMMQADCSSTEPVNQ
jgi:hypothetical protein